MERYVELGNEAKVTVSIKSLTEIRAEGVTNILSKIYYISMLNVNLTLCS